MPLTFVVQRGEVVNPAVKSQQDEQFFLYSAIARPGNSDGPIVAQDGRVVGLVTHDLPDAKQKASPFYRGVPAGEIRRALSDLGAGGLIRWKAGSFEDVVRRRHRTACTAVAFKFHVQSRLLEVACSQYASPTSSRILWRDFASTIRPPEVFSRAWHPMYGINRRSLQS